MNPLYKQLVKDKGITINPSTNQINPNTGYFGSYMGKGFTIPLKTFNELIFKKHLNKLIQSNKALLENESNFVGVWIDKGLVYFDISRQFELEQDCKEFCWVHYQKAYYDAKHKKTIYLFLT